MKPTLFPLVGLLLPIVAFAADALYGVFPRPATQPTFKVYSSGLSPFTIVHNTGPRTLLFQDLDQQGLAGPSHVAYVADHKVRIAPTNAPIDPSSMTESWMLFLFHSAKGWDKIKNTPYVLDIPVFVVLQKMPSEIKPAGSGLEFVFPNESGYIAIMPFFGTSFIRATQTAAWKDSLPQDIFLRCRMLAELSREYPIKVEESFKVFPAQDKVIIRDRFDFLSIDDDWKTGHKKIAPLEYPVSLANRYKFRLLSVAGNVVDLDTPVGAGCWAGVEADESSYTLTGLLRYINTVEQPKQVPADHPLLAEARKNFDWQLPPRTPGSLAKSWSRAITLAAHLPYADPPTQQFLRRSFEHLADQALDPKQPPTLRPDWPLPVELGDLFRGLHDMTAATRDLAIISSRWSLLRDAYRALPHRTPWGDGQLVASRSESFDSSLTVPVCFARMAWWMGDDDMYRLASYEAAKQFLALWATSAAYPKWVIERRLYASVCAAAPISQVPDDNAAIVLTDPKDPGKTTLALQEVPFSRAGPGNLGFGPFRLHGFDQPTIAEMRFIKDRMPDHARFFLDAFARKYMPDFHKAAYLEQSQLPTTPPALPFQQWYQSLLKPLLDDWDFYFDVPLAQRPARHEKFWQNNGGIKGHEFDIILAGIDRKYVSLWQGSNSPPPDPVFRIPPPAENRHTLDVLSPVFYARLQPDVASFFWLGAEAPVHDRDGPPLPHVRIGIVRPR